MKTTASKENSTPSLSSQPFFNKKGEGSFLSSTNEQEQPFFSPNPGIQRNLVSSSSSGEHNFANIPIFSPRSQPVIQPKLTINEPGDKYEQEADAMADRVMRMSAPLGEGGNEGMLQVKQLNINTIQDKCAACEEEEKVQRQEMEEDKSLQTKPLMRKSAEGGGYTASPLLASQLDSSEGGGDPLPRQTLVSMNQAFGADFSKVRIHDDSHAAEMSQGIQAKAFTYGADIYFNMGHYSPGSLEGRRLIAHELSHVVQQKGMPQKSIQKQSIHDPGYPCIEQSGRHMPGGMDYFGTLAHLRIQQYYISEIDPSASSEYEIPNSGGRGGRGRADIVSSNGGIYEIKPAGLARDGFMEAQNYLMWAERMCNPNVSWHLGDVYRPKHFTIVTDQIFSWLYGPGVIVYQRLGQSPPPFFPPFPVPFPKRIEEKLKNLIKKIKEYFDIEIDWGKVATAALAALAIAALIIFIPVEAIGAAVAAAAAGIIFLVGSLLGLGGGSKGAKSMLASLSANKGFDESLTPASEYLSANLAEREEPGMYAGNSTLREEGRSTLHQKKFKDENIKDRLLTDLQKLDWNDINPRSLKIRNGSPPLLYGKTSLGKRFGCYLDIQRQQSKDNPMIWESVIIEASVVILLDSTMEGVNIERWTRLYPEFGVEFVDEVPFISGTKLIIGRLPAGSTINDGSMYENTVFSHQN